MKGNLSNMISFLDLSPFPTSTTYTERSYNYEGDNIHYLSDKEIREIIKKTKKSMELLQKDIDRKKSDTENDRLVSDYPIYKIEEEIQNSLDYIERLNNELESRKEDN